MPAVKGAIPELISFVFSLILFALGVPSIVDIGIMIIMGMQNAFPSSVNIPLYVILLRVLGWFLIIEAILRISIQFREGKYF